MEMPGILSLARTPETATSRRWSQFSCNYVLLAGLMSLHASLGAAVVGVEVVSACAAVSFADVIEG